MEFFIIAILYCYLSMEWWICLTFDEGKSKLFKFIIILNFLEGSVLISVLIEFSLPGRIKNRSGGNSDEERATACAF